MEASAESAEKGAREMVFTSCWQILLWPRRRFLAAALAFFSLLAAGAARAATVEVDAGITAGSCCVFNTPGTNSNITTVNVGDTVHWVWKTNAHSVSSDTGAWTDSGVKNTGFTFDVTFATAGSFAYHCSIHGGVGRGMAGTINVVAPSATVTGNLALEGVSDLTLIKAPLGVFHISLRTPGTTTEKFGYDVTPAAHAGSANGSYTLTAVTPGTYDVAIKGGKNLRVVKSSVVIAGTSGVVPDVLLSAGDSNGDNSVDSTDFGTLIGAFNSSASIVGSGYDPTADFNFDGIVDSADFGLLIGEFNNTGAS